MHSINNLNGQVQTEERKEVDTLAPRDKEGQCFGEFQINRVSSRLPGPDIALLESSKSVY